MSTMKEKYISEAKLKDVPKRKLSLMIGDQAVTTPKIKDQAVTSEKLSAELANELASLRSDANSTNNIINILQRTINELRESLPEGLILDGNIDSVEYGTQEDLELNARTSSGKDASWGIYVDGEMLFTESDTSSISYTMPVSGDTQVEVHCTVDDFTYKGIWKVSQMFPYYVGGGSSYQSVAVEANKQAAKSDVSGKYTFSMSTGQKMFFIVPPGVGVESITMNGFDVPLEDITTVTLNIGGLAIAYRVYSSANVYQSGTYTIVVNSYTGSSADVIDSLVNNISNINEQLLKPVYYIVSETPNIVVNASGQQWEVVTRPFHVYAFEYNNGVTSLLDIGNDYSIEYSFFDGTETSQLEPPFVIDPTTDVQYFEDGYNGYLLKLRNIEEKTIATLHIPLEKK